MDLSGTFNPARPAAGVELCRLDEIDDPGGRGFDFREGEAIFMGFVVRQGERALGYVDSCPHAGWPLAAAPNRYLTRDGQRLFCGGHGAVFRIEDGFCIAGPCAEDSLEPWPVEVLDGMVRTA